MDIGLEIKNLNNMIHRHFTNLKTTEILNKLTGSNGYIIVYLMEHQNELIRNYKIYGTYRFISYGGKSINNTKNFRTR